MATFHDDLERDLRLLANADDQLAMSEQRLLSKLPRPQTRARTRRRAAIIAIGSAAAAVGTVAALNTAGIVGQSADRPQQDADGAPRSAQDLLDGYDGLPVVEPGEPCPIAVQLPTDLSLLKSLVSVPIFAPSGTISRAWRCGDTPVLMYGGVQVSYEDGWADVDVPKKWADLAADYGGTIDTIAGRPALVQPASGEGSRNQVMIVVGDTLIRFLSSDDLGMSQLTTLAQTLRVP